MNAKNARLWVVLFAMVLFLSGLAAGVVLRPWFGLGLGGFAPPRAPGRVAPRNAQALIERVATQIELSDQQRERLEQLFDARRQRFREINLEVRQRFEAEQEDLRAQIGEILTPAQVEIFENEIVRLGDERRQRRGGGRGRPGLPPGGGDR